jgi:hypothetical protein
MACAAREDRQSRQEPPPSVGLALLAKQELRGKFRKLVLLLIDHRG